MAEEFCGGANWWDSTTTTRSRYDGGGGGGGGSSSTSSTTTTVVNGGGSGYGWLAEATDINAASSGFQDAKMEGSSASLLVSLGLSSHTMDWNQQPLLRNPEKAENSFRTMLEEGMGLNTNFHQINRGFCVDQPQFSASCSPMESTVTCQGLTGGSFQVDSSSSSAYCSSPLQTGLMGCDHQQTPTNNYTQNDSNYFDDQHSQLSSCSWAKVPQFLLASSLKQIQHQQQQQQQQFQFTNNAPYWNASAPTEATMVDVRPNFFSSSPTQLPVTMIPEQRAKSTLETREISSTMKKSITESNNKRARNEGASSTLPPFKVKKEKMGDRITALQQLVSPFGKTDTASVLSEAIEYIKFLHEQVSVLTNPYLKNGVPYQQHQPEKVKMDPEGPKQDLRSRGLCLVPVSSTFPVTHETTVDFWTPTFGGTFR